MHLSSGRDIINNRFVEHISLGDATLSSFVLGVLGIFFSWIVLAVLFSGFGLLILRALGPASLHSERILASFWLGFAGVIAVLQLWHFFFPITARAFLLIAVLGVIGIFLNRSALQAWLNQLHATWRNVPAVTTLLVVGLWMADWAAGRCLTFDSGLYHIPAVHWAKTYPLVPGLGNLQDQLAFNSSTLLYAAMTGIGTWSGKSNHLANGLLVFVFMVQVVLSGFRGMSPRKHPSEPWMFDVLLAVSLVTVVVAGDISSLSTDVAPAIVLLVAGSLLYRWLTTLDAGPFDDAYNTLVLMPLLCLAVCLKETAVVFSSITFVIMVGLMWKRPKPAIVLRALWCAGTLTVVLGVSWMLRSIVLSGYPFYPNPIASASVEWRLPLELARAQTAWVTAYARQSVEPGLAWLRPWWSASTHGPDLFLFLIWLLIPSALALAAGAGYLVAARRFPPNRATRRGWLLGLPIAAGIAFWFFKIPSPRFGFYIFWMAAALTVEQLVRVFPAATQLRFRPGLAAAAIVLASLTVFLQRPTGWIDPAYGFLKGIVHSAIIAPTRRGGIYSLPTAQLTVYQTDSGLKLLVPVNDRRCWDAPLPCTPHPAPDLIQKTRFGRPEFVTQGPWEQVNWPFPQSDFLPWFRAHESQKR